MESTRKPSYVNLRRENLYLVVIVIVDIFSPKVGFKCLWGKNIANLALHVHFENSFRSRYNSKRFLFLRGRFSVVKKCVDKVSGKEYAAKFIKKRMCSKHDVEREVLILRRLKHPNLNVIVDSFENDKNWILVMELLPSGRLFDSIVVASPWTEKEAVGFVKQILEAVQHLHDCRVAHLDLKVRLSRLFILFLISY